MLNVPECSRMHAESSKNVTECLRMFKNVQEWMQKVPECSRMLRNACRISQNVPEGIQNVPEWLQNVPEGIQIVPEYMQNVTECYKMHAECSIMFQNVTECSKMNADLWACMQLHELTCSYISFMELHELALHKCVLGTRKNLRFSNSKVALEMVSKLTGR